MVGIVDAIEQQAGLRHGVTKLLFVQHGGKGEIGAGGIAGNEQRAGRYAERAGRGQKRPQARDHVAQSGGIGVLGREAVIGHQNRHPGLTRQQPGTALMRFRAAEGKSAAVDEQHRASPGSFRYQRLDTTSRRAELGISRDDHLFNPRHCRQIDVPPCIAARGKCTALCRRQQCGIDGRTVLLGDQRQERGHFGRQLRRIRRNLDRHRDAPAKTSGPRSTMVAI